MTNKIITGIGIIGVLFLSGCAQPTVNPNNGKMEFINGKPYYIPRYAAYINHPAEFTMVYNLGICKKNGLLWTSEQALFKTDGQIANVSGNIKLNAKQLKQSVRNGKSGCIYPLSDQEYSYRLNQSNQANADRRASKKRTSDTWNNISTNTAIRNAALMPKTYNVNVHHY